jgi:hypothetical protein
VSRRLASALVLALLLTLLPIGTTVVLAAPPQTVSVRIDGLTAAASATDGVRRAAAVSASAGEVRSRPVRAAIPFAMVGLQLPSDVEARVRTSPDGVSWGPWLATEHLPSGEGPDAGSAEAQAASTGFTEAVWVGPSRYLEVATTGGDPSEVEVVAIDSAGLNPGTRRTEVRTVSSTPAADAASTSGFSYRSRAEWGADESKRSGSIRYADTVRHAVVHHTAGSNDYGPEDGPAIVRGIYHYHTQALGWNDIGYNALVDRFGVVYEGRAGGLDRAVIGAHAAGYNTGSFGISVMGTFMDGTAPSAAVSAVSDVLAWKLQLHGIDPYGKATVGEGSGRRTINTISGHRDVGSTSCPGDELYADLDVVRGRTAQRMQGGSPPSDNSRSGFSDVDGSVHADAIRRIVEEGVTSGCDPDRYCPHAAVTRGQMATFLSRALDLPEGSGARFSDVDDDHTHEDGIAAVVDAGIASGYDDGTFRPQAPVTREHLAAMLRRGLDLAPEDGVRYRDTAGSPYLGAINAVSSAAITGGCTDELYCPAADVTRGQMASFLRRTLDHLADS